MLLGVHCSIAGGTFKAFDEVERLKIDTMQIFTRNQRQWKAKPIDPEEKKIFTQRARETAIGPIVSHTSYLINPGATNEEIYAKSVQALTEEVIRCTELGVSYCVLHPGAAGESPLAEALIRIANALQYVIDATRDSKVMILLENTAGQGTSVGGKFENLRDIKDLIKSDRVGFCMDTCHSLAAGYDIANDFEGVMTEFDKVCGLQHLKVFHFNDSKGGLGSHLDRHEHIGKGKIGVEAFRFLMKNFPDRPKLLETPKEDDMDMVNLQVLRDLV